MLGSTSTPDPVLWLLQRDVITYSLICGGTVGENFRGHDASGRIGG
jgi:hypothetical protein